MELGYTPEQEALRAELRAYYDTLLDPQTVAELSQGHGISAKTRSVWKQMCADGWAGIGWPKEYGGQGKSPIEQFIFFDESMRSGAPVPMLSINTVGPTIMQFGTDDDCIRLDRRQECGNRLLEPLLGQLRRRRGQHRRDQPPHDRSEKCGVAVDGMRDENDDTLARHEVVALIDLRPNRRLLHELHVGQLCRDALSR